MHMQKACQFCGPGKDLPTKKKHTSHANKHSNYALQAPRQGAYKQHATGQFCPCSRPRRGRPHTGVIMANATNGKSAHHNWYKGVGRFVPTCTLAFGGGPNNAPANPWQENSNGRTFYLKVLAHQPATVQKAIDMGKATMGLQPRQVQDHLRWLYTWYPHTYMQVNGVGFNPQDTATWHTVAAPAAPAPLAATPVQLAAVATPAPAAPAPTLVPAPKAPVAKAKK